MHCENLTQNWQDWQRSGDVPIWAKLKMTATVFLHWLHCRWYISCYTVTFNAKKGKISHSGSLQDPSLLESYHSILTNLSQDESCWCQWWLGWNWHQNERKSRLTFCQIKCFQSLLATNSFFCVGYGICRMTTALNSQRNTLKNTIKILLNPRPNFHIRFLNSNPPSLTNYLQNGSMRKIFSKLVELRDMNKVIQYNKTTLRNVSIW